MNQYEKQYKSMQFERAGLFKAVHERYQSRDVLYPGCSVHITPSLYFPHVVYVDQSEAAAQFFADERSIAQFVSRNKHYEQSAYVRFVQQDYSMPLPLMEEKFDLLLALFAGGIAESCAVYLKVGGILLTNNHQGDAMDAAKDPNFELVGIIQFQKGTYSIKEVDLDGPRSPAQKLNNKYLKQVNDDVEYIENETYYIFQRSR
jgi:hypothetical protein